MFAHAAGPYVALAFRRGITHGVPALLVLPFLVTGVILALDRGVRRRRDPTGPPARARGVLALAFIGVWTHPLLDWLNTYGMRWWLPVDGRWSYGDALFIVDPWLWLLLAGPVFLARSDTRRSRIGWALFACLLSLPVLATGMAPPGARLLWVGGIAGWAWLRVRVRADPGAEGGRRERIARRSAVAAAAYVLLMVLTTPIAERIVRTEAGRQGVEGIEGILVGPVPANPWEGAVVLRLPHGYRTGSFRWWGAPRLQLDSEPLPSHPRDAIVLAAEQDPDLRRYLVWARFPRFEVHPDPDGWVVEVTDPRYSAQGGTGGALAGIRVYLDEDLRLRR